MQTIEEKKEQFEYWLFDMDNVLEEFISKYQSESLLLDYSIASWMVLKI